MHATAPLARTVSSAWQQSCSRIPHLQFHISRHRARAGKVLSNTRLVSQQYTRPQSSFASASDFDAIDTQPISRWEDSQSHSEASNSHATHDKVDPQVKASSSSDSATIQPVNIHDLVQEGHPNRILIGLLDPVIGQSFIANASQPDFEQAFCALDPDYFLKDIKAAYRHIDSSLYRKPASPIEKRFEPIRTIDERLSSFTNIVDGLLATRHEAGHPLGLPVLRHSLKWAEATGNLQLARAILHNLMPVEHVKPDLQCYNSFLGAMAWSNTYSTAERYRLRVTTLSLARRSHGFGLRPPYFAGHRTAPPDRPNVVRNSIRAIGLRIFKQLVSDGFSGDEKTFCSLMITLSREGDIDAVQSVLKSVWNIDVKMLDSFDEEEVQSPTYYADDSPLHPSNLLLSTIVHTFCINNDYQSAASLLDYTSRNYNLTISPDVWSQLLMWGHALSSRRTNQRRRLGLDVGQLARTKVQDILQLMQDEPYEITPDVYTMTLGARASQSVNRLAAIVQLRKSAALLEDERTELSLLYDETLAAIETLKNTSQWDGFIPAWFHDTRKRFVKLALEVETHRNMIVRTLRRVLFHSDELAGGGKRFVMSCLTVPNLIDEFAQYLPQHLAYQTPTGTLVIKSNVHRAVAIENANDFQLSRVGIVRAALDTDTHDQLLENIAALSDKMSVMDDFCSWCGDWGHTGRDCGKRQLALEGGHSGDSHRRPALEEVDDPGAGESELGAFSNDDFQESSPQMETSSQHFQHLHPPESPPSVGVRVGIQRTEDTQQVWHPRPDQNR